MPWQIRAAALCGALLFLATPGAALAQDASPASVKAAYLLNFARYAEWPTQSAEALAQELTLCVIGGDRTDIDLARLDHQNIQGRELRVRRGIALEAMDQCEMLFVSEIEQSRLAAILRATEGRAILTVSDVAGFVEAGGMIGLVPAGARVQFDVNLNAVRRSELWLSPQVLRLARAVIGAKEAR